MDADGRYSEEVAQNLEHSVIYEVKKGDALIKIARKFDMTVAQLKQFNDLTDDRIRVGQTLRIPTPGQVLTLVPPPPPPTEPKQAPPAKKKTAKPALAPPPEPADGSGGEAQRELDNVLLQVFLDRAMFSPGMAETHGPCSGPSRSRAWPRSMSRVRSGRPVEVATSPGCPAANRKPARPSSGKCACSAAA